MSDPDSLGRELERDPIRKWIVENRPYLWLMGASCSPDREARPAVIPA
jgi:hypothetical protein